MLGKLFKKKNRWSNFSEVELSELSISLDHRLAEAPKNMYVYTDVVEELILDLEDYLKEASPHFVYLNDT